MNKKKVIKRIDLVIQAYLIYSLATLDYQLFQTYQTLKIAYQNPYHHFDGDVQKLNTIDQQLFIQEYVSDLKDYPLFEQAKKIDQEMFVHLESLCLNNPYIDYAKMADRIALSNVQFDSMLNQQDQTVQATTSKNYMLTLLNINQGGTITVYNADHQGTNLREVYYHELIHTLFPFINNQFLEEGLTDIMTKEFMVDKPSSDVGYPLYNVLLKMWIETLGADVFKEMRATGSLEPFRQALVDLDYSEVEISTMLAVMEETHKIYRILPDDQDKDESTRQWLMKEEACFKKLLVDVEGAYERKYHKPAKDNIIMCCYKNQLLKYYHPELPTTYYEAIYFENPRTSDEIIWEDQHGKEYGIPLEAKDYNLGGTSKTYIR